MVSTAWLLLSLSCKAEDLRVQLPLKGVDSMNQEDLQRDLWLRMQVHSRKEFGQKIGGRLKAMGLEPTPQVDCLDESQGKCCARFVGAGDPLKIASLDDDSLAGMLSTVALITLAKGFSGSNRSRNFCIFFAPPMDSEFMKLGDITGKGLQFEPLEQRFVSQTRVENAEDIQFERLLGYLKSIVVQSK